jgi:hypothetical protein
MAIVLAQWMYEVPAPPRVRALVGIYVLTHPDTNEVIYVGQSNAPATRLNDHIRWWQKQHHYTPKMYVVEEVPEEMADERELHFIDFYIANGASILNFQASDSHPRTGCFSYSIDDMRTLAAHHAGKCLSESFGGVRAKLTWECKRGHIWEAVPISVLKGAWCSNSECARERRGKPRADFTKHPRRSK